MRRQAHRFWQAYMSSKEKVLDTTMAVVRQRLGIEPPFFKDVRTQDATKPAESYFMDMKEHKWHQSTSQEVYFRWNDVFYPWVKIPFEFHKGIQEPQHTRFPMSSGQSELGKFTVVVMGYKRQESMRELLAGLSGFNKIDRVLTN